MYKTGGGEVDDDAYLTQLEESMLDYVGVEGVVGKYIYIYTGIFRYIYKYKDGNVWKKCILKLNTLNLLNKNITSE